MNSPLLKLTSTVQFISKTPCQVDSSTHQRGMQQSRNAIELQCKAPNENGSLKSPNDNLISLTCRAVINDHEISTVSVRTAIYRLKSDTTIIRQSSSIELKMDTSH